ncbi:MAG: HTTM domain-containing protein [Fuerstiella sp.]|nr:HTTM domain-containing protein [Fuerstiella sp.]MCP4855389.1 HTTM domain-containing protein [Fuerstiella sp.]
MSPVPANTLPRRCRNALHDAADQWQRFWFDPADPFTLGMIRLLTGSMLVYTLWVWGLDLNAFFASDGLQPLSTMLQFYQNDFVFSFFYFVSDEWLVIVHWSCVIVAIMFCLGLATRLTSVLAFLITISYSQRVPIANFGLDQILGLLCLYLAVGPSGSAFSIDQLIRDRWRKSKGLTIEVRKFASARTALRLIQIHLCVIYFWAGFSKLKGDTWWTGEAMWQVIASQEYQTVDLTWMAWIPWLPYLIAHATVVWEVFFCVLVWNRRLRPLMLALGTGMHFGIGAFLGLWTFALIMTYCYFAFGNPEWWRHLLSFSDRRNSGHDVEGVAD